VSRKMYEVHQCNVCMAVWQDKINDDKALEK